MIKELREIDKRILSTLRETGKIRSIDLAPLLGMKQKDLLQQLISLSKRGYLGFEFFDEMRKIKLWYALAKRREVVSAKLKKPKYIPKLDEPDEWFNGLKVKKPKPLGVKPNAT